MTRPIEAPVSKTESRFGNDTETTTTHPAFAQISASRVSGSAQLYASDFKHNAFMTIRIARSELHRSLNRDWHFARDEIIEVAMSESQWATFVSSPNMGGGVPCTIQRLQGEMIAGLPAPESRTDQFAREIKEDLAGCIANVDAALAELAQLGLSKAKAEKMKNALEATRRELIANLPFTAQQFDEHMEDTVERAKQEVHGHMNGVIQRAGLAALSGGLPLQIEHRED